MRLINGDCLEEMKKLEDNSVDTILTDPPYNLSFMGKDWDAFPGNQAFQEWTRQWATEALRVAKPGAMMLCFGGTRTFHRIACGIEDAGWEIRDTMLWIYGSGFPKSYNISKGIDKKAGAEREVVGKSEINIYKDNKNHKFFTEEEGNPEYEKGDITAPSTEEAQLWDGWGTALKPAFEPIIVAMKPRDGTFVENALKWGVAGLNIDGGRVPTGEDTTTRHNSSSSYMTQSIGEVQPKQDEYVTGSVRGRWPANIVHDGSEEVLAWFPNGSQRYFYCAKASKKERNAGLDGMEEHKRDESRNADQLSMNGGSGNPYNRGAKPVTNNHPTVKPLSLMTYLTKLTKTPTGGTVLDPFMGSGTTGMACKKVGRDFIGIELDEHYFEIAEKRIASVIQEELI